MFSSSDRNNSLITNIKEMSGKSTATTVAKAVGNRNRYYDYYYDDHDNKPSNDYDIIFLFEINLQNNAASY